MGEGGSGEDGWRWGGWVRVEVGRMGKGGGGEDG